MIAALYRIATAVRPCVGGSFDGVTHSGGVIAALHGNGSNAQG